VEEGKLTQARGGGEVAGLGGAAGAGGAGVWLYLRTKGPHLEGRVFVAGLGKVPEGAPEGSARPPEWASAQSPFDLGFWAVYVQFRRGAKVDRLHRTPSRT
jgi:hypothetical protein